jgi:uncharacterized protein YceK
MTKSLVALFGLAVLVLGMTGCSTITESTAERSHNIGVVAHYDLLEFNEDVDSFLLLDHPSRLTYWMVR